PADRSATVDSGRADGRSGCQCPSRVLGHDACRSRTRAHDRIRHPLSSRSRRLCRPGRADVAGTGHCRWQCRRDDRRSAAQALGPVELGYGPTAMGCHRGTESGAAHLRRQTTAHSHHQPRDRSACRTAAGRQADPAFEYCPARDRRSLLLSHRRADRPGGRIMTATTHRPQHSQPRKSQAEILVRFVGWEFWRNFRMLDATFFVIVLPAAMYLMFGVAMDQGELPAGYGNVSAYVMTSMAVYGAVISTTAMAGSAAVERNMGWGRQLNLTGLTEANYVLGKMLMALLMAISPI